MTKDVKLHEVVVSFLARQQAFVPVTAETEAEAKEYATYLFREYENVEVDSIKTVDMGGPQPSPVVH